VAGERVDTSKAAAADRASERFFFRVNAQMALKMFAPMERVTAVVTAPLFGHWEGSWVLSMTSFDVWEEWQAGISNEDT
jgi:hypothetical protein